VPWTEARLASHRLSRRHGRYSETDGGAANAKSFVVCVRDHPDGQIIVVTDYGPPAVPTDLSGLGEPTWTRHLVWPGCSNRKQSGRGMCPAQQRRLPVTPGRAGVALEVAPLTTGVRASGPE
jgi:hypothetical protein